MREPGSARWRLFFRALFLTGPAFAFVRRRRPLPPVEELAVVGRRTGLERRVLVHLIETGGRLYVAEPSGLPTHWTDNLAMAGRAAVIYADGRRLALTA